MREHEICLESRAKSFTQPSVGRFRFKEADLALFFWPVTAQFYSLTAVYF